MQYVKCRKNDGYELDLTMGAIYKALFTAENEQSDGWIRIIDNEGEDYLYPAVYFESIDQAELVNHFTESITIHLNELTKVEVRDRANERGVTMSALVREWIDEHLDLPSYR